MSGRASKMRATVIPSRLYERSAAEAVDYKYIYIYIYIYMYDYIHKETNINAVFNIHFYFAKARAETPRCKTSCTLGCNGQTSLP